MANRRLWLLCCAGLACSESSTSGIAIAVAGTSLSAVTDDGGAFAFPAVPTGLHDVVASMAGRTSAAAAGVRVLYAQDARAPDLTLAVRAAGAGSISGRVLLQ